MTRGATVGLVVAGVVLLLTLLAVFPSLFLTGSMLGGLGSGDPDPVGKVRVARAEARALADADETAGDAIGFLLLAAHDGDAAALEEARAFADGEVTEAAIRGWIAAAKEAVAADPAAVDAQVLRSGLATEDGRDVATCEVVARAGDEVVRARVVLVRRVVAVAGGELDQWGVVEMAFEDD